MTKIATRGDLDDLIEKIKAGNTHFIGYAPPYAMIADGNQMHDVPIGHLIPALMAALGQGSNANRFDAPESKA